MRVGDAHLTHFDAEVNSFTGHEDECDCGSCLEYWQQVEVDFAWKRHDRNRRTHIWMRQRQATTGCEVLSDADTRSLEIQTGVRMTHRDQLNSWLDQEGLRCGEKGDAQAKRTRESDEWYDSGDTDEKRGDFPYKQAWKVVDSQYKPG